MLPTQSRLAEIMKKIDGDDRLTSGGGGCGGGSGGGRGGETRP